MFVLSICFSIFFIFADDVGAQLVLTRLGLCDFLLLKNWVFVMNQMFHCDGDL